MHGGVVGAFILLIGNQLLFHPPMHLLILSGVGKNEEERVNKSWWTYIICVIGVLPPWTYRYPFDIT
jgi:hypothetical protein